ncbi:MAG: molybdopterin-synthase adenylyltransferase MoeB [Nitrososphaerota archaeon]|jgi:adenylyltransferase/sulfurtransferase|nr:molybdopterin-synthase adenylyltransferase MoeB [Nitrososphaerota archaeon]MDG6955420.1 molybdopterin-synthase adenylyltransferase MoeB [Nitrososphaerota archaeon]
MPGQPDAAELSRDEIERYSRQLTMPEIGPEGQRKLKGSSVLVVGAGGLGVPASIYLAAAGVGKVGIVDDDIIAKSNLHRQVIYTEADVGRGKADVAAQKLREVNPHVNPVPHAVRLDSGNALEMVSSYDVILDCTDNFPARYLINDACVLSGKPDVYASVFRFDGQASVFYASRGPCYRCLFPEPPPPETVQDCSVAGVLGVLPGIMGSIQAAQATSLLLGKGNPLVGRLVLFDAMGMTFNELRFKKNKACPVCGPDPSIRALVDYDAFCGLRREPSPTEITPVELKRLVDEGKRIQLLDVREPFENSFGELEGSKHIPLGELEKRFRELDVNDPVVAYCLVGTRSAVAVDFLASRGYKARNLRGGVRAWADAVDPDFPVF